MCNEEYSRLYGTETVKQKTMELTYYIHITVHLAHLNDIHVV